MTIIEAINKIDSLKPNTYSQPEKIKWLSTLDGIIKLEIIDKYEGVEEEGFAEYTEDTPLTTELLVPAPFDDIYILFLESRIHYANEEYGKYNNATAEYNAAYTRFANHYNRTHMPKGKKFKYF